ncbi:MAG: DUF421 domain-containing protein [bacterium]|nr:DUF421 domain-containing protein [bacterium]
MDMLSLALLLLKEGSREEVRSLDWMRMFFSDLHWTYVFEVLVRGTIVFIFAILGLRMLGKRGVANLSPFEFAILLAFGTLIGDPSLYHDTGMVFALVAGATIIAMYRLFAWLTMRSSRLSALTESTPRQLVCSGVLDNEGMRMERLSHSDIFEMLREKGVRHLGEVEYAFLETSGHLSTFCFMDCETLPGLPIVPPHEVQPPGVFKEGAPVLLEGYHACSNCGLTAFLLAGKLFSLCENCSHNEWMVAVPGSKGN